MIPDWVKVKGAAMLGVGTPFLHKLFENVGPVVEGLTQVGQFGVVIATLLYILAKWRAVRKSRKDDEKE